MTHSKLDIDWILEQLYAFGQQDGLGENHPSHIRKAKQALLEAFEQSLPGEHEIRDTEDPQSKAAKDGYNAYRNEAIKVIRGTE